MSLRLHTVKKFTATNSFNRLELLKKLIHLFIHSFRYSHVQYVSHFTWEKTTQPFVQQLFCSIHSHICYLISRLEQTFERERGKKKKDEPELLDIFFSPAKVLMVIHNYFPCYGLYFHPETIHISPPADVNQNITSLGLLTDLPSFVFLSPSQRF